MLAQTLWSRFIENPFYPYALLGGVGVALLCSVLSVFVVLKRLAFIGQGISHAAFGGVGVALLLSIFYPVLLDVLYRDAVIAGFCVLTAVMIGLIASRGRLAEDTAIGITLVAGMALGVLLMDMRMRWSGGYTAPIQDILFGDLLFIRPAEIWIVWGLALGVLGLTLLLFRQWVFFLFDDETSVVFGVPARALYYGLLVCLGLAVVAAMRTLGVILASALLVLPGAGARMWSQRIGLVMLASILLGVGGLVGGFFLAIALNDLSFGGVIVLLLCVLFALSYVAKSVRNWRARRKAPLLN